VAEAPSGFGLDPAFVATSHEISDLPLCHARLQDDVRYPWIVLIPRLPGLREVEELSASDRARLVDEAVLAGTAVRAVGAVLGLAVEKLNLGALGNVTAQLHLHVVGRRADDPAWPGPVWGHSAGTAYGQDELARALAAARRAFSFSRSSGETNSAKPTDEGGAGL
jgi:diadenosine tetraphosphate (Ap4A) HIT family hydrolase